MPNHRGRVYQCEYPTGRGVLRDSKRFDYYAKEHSMMDNAPFLCVPYQEKFGLESIFTSSYSTKETSAEGLWETRWCVHPSFIWWHTLPFHCLINIWVWRNVECPQSRFHSFVEGSILNWIIWWMKVTRTSWRSQWHRRDYLLFRDILSPRREYLLFRDPYFTVSPRKCADSSDHNVVI